MLLGTPGCAEMVCFFANSSVIIAFVPTQQHCRSAIRTKTPCGVRYVFCHVQVAFLLSRLSPPWCQWCSDWSALGCSATMALVLRLFVARFWLADVDCGVRCSSIGVSCFLSCWGAGKLFRRGIRTQAAAASCPHVSYCGCRELVV